jgi:probable addiction module antidote protein
MATMKFSTFDFSQHLDNPKTIAAYLDSILEEDDPGLLAAALGDIARARGMAEIASASGLTREALYKALRPGSAPRFDTISRVLKVFDLELKIVAGKSDAKPKKQRALRTEASKGRHRHSELPR